MAFERWGSLSVADHVDSEALVANVLLYDRLVIPVMTPAADRNEREYWISHGWDPDLQEKRLDQLGDLAIRRPWDATRRERYANRMAELRDERFDAQHIDAFGMTRMILAQEQVTEKRPGVNHVDVIAAYNSTAGARKDIQFEATDQPIAAQAVLLARRLAVPDLRYVDDTLKLAIELSQDAEFREKRSDMFEWQERMVAKGVPAEAVVDELSAMTDRYNAAVRKASKNVLYRYAFTIAGIALGFATGGVVLGTGVSAGLALLQFAMFDTTSAVDAGNSRPGAMFHDIENQVGVTLQNAD